MSVNPIPPQGRSLARRAGHPAAALALLWGIVVPAWGATYTVTTLDDNGPGSLRAAVQAANDNPGPDVVRFAVDGTIRLYAPIEVTDDLRIDGQARRVTLHGGNQTTLLVLSEEAKTLDVARLTFEHASYSQSTGGAIHSRGVLRVSESLFLHSVAPVGGAIYSSGRTLEVSNSTFAWNRALSWGGAVAVGASTQAVISHSTFVGNDAAQFGGALFQNPIYVSHPQVGSMMVRNSVIAGSAIKGNCSVISNRLLDGGGNLNSDGSCPFSSDKGSVNHAQPMLGDLQHHGGPTRTFAPLPGSPVIDGAVAVPASVAQRSTDQRGFLRIAGPAPDRGAVELQAGDTGAPTLDRPRRPAP